MVRMSEWEQTVSLELWFEEKKNAGCLTVKQCSILGFKFRGENYFQSVFVLVSMTLLRCENPKAVCGPWKVRERTEYCPLHLLPSFDSHAADMVTHRQVGLWIILLPTHDCPFLSLSLCCCPPSLFANSYSWEAHSHPKVSVCESCQRAQGLSKQGESGPLPIVPRVCLSCPVCSAGRSDQHAWSHGQ